MEDKTIVFFDGDCLLCQGALKWLNRLDADNRLRFAPLQGRTAREYRIDLDNDSMAAAENGEVWRSSEALRRACLRSGGVGWGLSVFLALIPFPIREWGYRLVAKNRKRLLKSPSCGLPEEGMKEKMLP